MFAIVPLVTLGKTALSLSTELVSFVFFLKHKTFDALHEIICSYYVFQSLYKANFFLCIRVTNFAYDSNINSFATTNNIKLAFVSVNYK